MALDQPQIDLELDEGEEILYIGRRHWIELVQNGFVFIIVLIISASMAVYRAVGGTFIVSDVAEGGMDFFNIVLLLVIGALGVLWWRASQQKQQKQRVISAALLYLLAIGALALLFVFRARGGRLLYIDPFDASPFDTFNIVLIVTALLCVAALVYLYIDWIDDFLVLTNTRVVYDDEQLLIRHVQQQILIDDIQQVSVEANTYPAALLGYGKITLRSFSPRRLEFIYAARPQEIAGRISSELNKLRKQQSANELRTLLEDQVYNNKPPRRPGPAIHVEERAGPLPIIFRPNPEIDLEKEQVTWRPAWIFLLLALLRPVFAFLLVLFIMIVVLRLEIIPPLYPVTVGVVGLLATAFWAYWVYEEHEHDLYILNRQEIIDVDKRPFGPESRRRAPLSAIQDVSFDISFLESWLGFGTVVIETGGASGGKFTFNHVPDPRGVQATINDYLTDFKKRDRYKSFQDAIALLREYHQLQSTKGELVDEARIAAVWDQKMAEYAANARPTQPIVTPRATNSSLRQRLLRTRMLNRRRRAAGQ